MRTLFDKIAQRFWTHDVRPEGVSRRRRRINPPLSAKPTNQVTGGLIGSPPDADAASCATLPKCFVRN
jgi:hypothetical protein